MLTYLKNTFLLLLLIFIGVPGQAQERDRQPNIIVILADDLGYGELGVYGQEKIKTPNIDALANSGMKFTQHYSGAPVCAPARYVLLTGLHTGHAYIRGNDEWSERGNVWDYEAAFHNPVLEGQRPIPDTTVTIGHILQQAGYKTSIIGKWGLGAPNTSGVPNKQGFDYFYGYNCQRQAHNLYPSHLWENEKKILLDNALVSPTVKLDSTADPYQEESYAKFSQNEYAPQKMHQKAISFIRDHQDQPFFMYYASPLPHLPLQVPKGYVDKYREPLGEEEPYTGNDSYFPNRHPKAAYAGMITYLDDQVGDLIVTLKEQGLYDNTIIFFTSDNGPTYLGGVDFEFFESSKPFSNGYGRTKGFLYEGGIRVPLIVSWPGKIKSGSSSDHISAFYDIMPTLCDLAGINVSKITDGLSFKPTLLGKEQEQHDFLYWEFPSYKGQQAVRLGKWKGIRKNIFDGNLQIELYDLETDIEEKNDVSDQHPDIISSIQQIMKQEHVPAENEKFKFKQLGDL